MCGEHERGVEHRSGAAGSSPHVRGARVEGRDVLGGVGIIPACAGSTRISVRWLTPNRDHPRMCGEHTSKIA